MNFSDYGKKILKNAHDEHSSIMVYELGANIYRIMVGKKEIYTVTDNKEKVEIRKALKELENNELIEFLSNPHSCFIYELTKKGYDLAELI